jgi:hypothetical protein
VLRISSEIGYSLFPSINIALKNMLGTIGKKLKGTMPYKMAILAETTNNQYMSSNFSIEAT